MPKTSVIDPSGTPRDVDDSELAAALQRGWRLPAPEEPQRLSSEAAAEENYGGLRGGVESVFAGLGRGLTLGGSDLALKWAGGKGAADDLKGLQQQNPIPSIGAEILGNVAPFLATGGAAGALAKTPAGLLSGVGKAIAEEGGSGLGGRALAATAGAAAEGGIQSGATYISQSALEDKPLSAEGFVGAVGHGALWAAPIGGALTLGEAGLIRARKLFPKAQVSAVAAQGIKREATAALVDAATDGEQMAQVARRQLDLVDAKTGIADLTEQQTRRAFGTADPGSIGDQITGGVEKAQLQEALSRYEASRANLNDWIRSEADPDLEAALLGVAAPEVGQPGGRIERLALGSEPRPAPNQDLLDALDMRARQLDSTAVGRKVPAALVEGVKDGGLSAADMKPAQTTRAGKRPLADLVPLSNEDFAAYQKAYSHAASNDHFAAETAYSKGGDEIVNVELRSGAPLSSEGRKLRDNLDAAMALPEARLRRDAVVYRGVSDDAIRGLSGNRARFANVKPGDVLQDPAFLSTAYSEAAKSRNEQIVFTISVPRGTPAIPLRGHYSGEGELLLPRDLKLRVDSVDVVPVTDRWKIKNKFEVLPDKSVKIWNKDGSISIEQPIKDIKVTAVHDGGPVDLVRPPVVNSDAPLDALSLRQIGEYQEDIDRLLKEAPDGASRDELYKKWDAAVARRKQLVDSPDLAPEVEYSIPGESRDTPLEAKTVAQLEDELGRLNRAIKLTNDDDVIGALDLKIGALHDRISEIVEFGLPVGFPTAPHPKSAGQAYREAGRIEVVEAGDGFEVHSPSGSVVKLRPAEVKGWVERQMPAGFSSGDIAVDRPLSIESAIPRSHADVADNAVYITRPSALADRPIFGSELSPTKVESIKSARQSGARLDPIRVDVAPSGQLYVSDGNHRLNEAAKSDSPIAIIFSKTAPGWKPSSSAKPISDRIKASLPVASIAVRIPSHADLIGKDDGVTQTVDSRVISEHGWYEPPGQGRDAVKADKARKAIAEGQRDPIHLGVTDDGKIIVGDGRNRLAAAVESGKPIKVKWEAAVGIGPDDVLKGGKPDGDLESLLRGTKAQLDSGVQFRDIKPANDLGAKILEFSEPQVTKALGKRPGGGTDIGPDIARAAKVITEHESSLAQLADALGPAAPPTAVSRAQAFRQALNAQSEAYAGSAAKAAQGIDAKVAPAMELAGGRPAVRTTFGGETVVDDQIQKAIQKETMRRPPAAGDATVVDDGIAKALRAHDMKSGRTAPEGGVIPETGRPGVLGKVADVGTALEVLQAMGVHVPDISSIPVIGPVLSLYLKARAVLGILGRKGGSVGRSTESIIAAKSAGLRNRIVSATGSALEVAARGARRAAEAPKAPLAILGMSLFPGGEGSKSKDPRVLYEARMDDLARAQRPGAVAQAVADRVQTSDPDLQDAITAQVERGIQFIASKTPKQSVLPGMLPGDGTWKPSKSSLTVWSRYVHAVNDPASVLEDLARGHLSIEGAEVLRVVYPKLFAEAQKALLEAAPKIQKTLPYSRRVAISIMYQVPVDLSMAPSHLQFLQAPAPGAQQPAQPQAPQSGPAITGPLQIGAQTMTALDRRAGM